MVSALVPGASGPGSSTVGTLAWPGSLWGVPANCWENLTNGSRMTCDGLASIPSRGSRNTPSHFMLQKLGISSGAMSQSALRLHFDGTSGSFCSHLLGKN